MKLVVGLEDQKTVRLGIVKLGTAVGKMKYSVICEADIPVIQAYKFDARLEIDRSGDGMRVFGMGHPRYKPGPPVPLQNIIWENKFGPVEPGYKVGHLNGITMDNRIDNLTLVPSYLSKAEQDSILRLRCTEPNIWGRRTRGWGNLLRQNNNGGEADEDLDENVIGETLENSNNSSFADFSDSSSEQGDEENKTERRRGENSLYWKAIVQLLSGESEEKKSFSTATFTRAYYTSEGELISRDCPSFYFFECHYPPCTALETEAREFAMCGRCQQARYCGRDCQRDDWTIHRDACSEVPRKRCSHSTANRSGKSSQRSAVKHDADR